MRLRLLSELTYRRMPIADAIKLLQAHEADGHTHASFKTGRFEEIQRKPKVKSPPRRPDSGTSPRKQQAARSAARAVRARGGNAQEQADAASLAHLKA